MHLLHSGRRSAFRARAATTLLVRAALTAAVLASPIAAAAQSAPAPAPSARAATDPAPTVGNQRATLEKIIQRRVLANGLEVIVVENHGVPIATVEIDVRNGSFTQTPGYEGLAHLYEHMFFNANLDSPSQEEFQAKLSSIGAIFNGTTNEEQVNYYLTVPNDRTEEGIALLAQALRAPLFLEDELTREREVVIGEYDRAESNPFWQLTTAMGKKLWGDQWSRKNTIGDRATILATTPAKMRAIQQRYYVPNNTALIVTGDVDPERIFALAQKHYGDWKRRPDPFADAPIPPIPPLARNAAVIVEQPVAGVIVLMQWHGPSVGADPGATYAADVFSDILNRDGSAFQRHLVDSGLWQAVGVNYYTLNHTGPITISGRTTPERFDEAMAALEREIAKVVEPGYFTAEELAAAKQQRAVGTAMGLERASGFAHTIGFWWSVSSLEYYMGYVDNMAAQTPDDLRDYARRYIIGKPHVTGVLLSSETRRAMGLTEADLLGERVTP
ncbi:MAG TPA: pitrilysin family protein [Gemmatimonadaceae bacterium]